MSGGLPPPPTRAENGSFAWIAWYNSLYKLLSTTGSVTWDLVNKAGSSITDLAAKGHNLLTGVLGTGSYHISATEATRLTAFYAVNASASDPGTGGVPDGYWAIYRHTGTGTVKLWVNIGGVMKSVTIA